MAILVWRHDYVSCFRLADSHEEGALHALGDRATFGVVCASLVDNLGEERGTERAGAMLGQWLGEGLIIDIPSE